MGVVIAVVCVIIIAAVTIWFFVAQTPERAASHAPPDDNDRNVERSHFAPGDAGTEGQAVPRQGEPGPSPSAGK